MDDRYVGLEGCEDLWELLRSAHQIQGLLKGWLEYFRQQRPVDNDPIIECEQAIDASEKCFAAIVCIYSRVFTSL